MEPNTQTLTDEEVAARNAELRKSNAEGEFVTICNDKKRVLAEITELENKKSDLNVSLEEINNQIQSSKNKLEETKLSLYSENQLLDKVISDRKNSEKELEDFIKSSNEKKDKISLEISTLEKSIEFKNSLAQKHLQEIEESKKLILNEIKIKQDYLVSLDNQKLQKEKEIENADNLYKESLNKKATIDLDSEKLNETISINKKILSETISSIEKLNTEISDKKIEIQNLNISIAAKNEEYKQSESKLISIRQRNDVLDQREAFLKIQYERAGIAW